MHELRTQIIADVITGQIDVRKSAAALSEHDFFPADDGVNGSLKRNEKIGVGSKKEVLAVAS